MTLDEFTKLIRTHQAGIRAYISALGASPDRIDDIAQESFLVAWKKKDDFDPGRDFGNWVRGIARRFVLREARESSRRGWLISPEITEALASRRQDAPEDDPDVTARLVAALRECMGQLPEKSVRLLQERYRNNTKAPALATRWGKSADAVRQAFARIRQKLRECIQGKVGEAVV